MKKRSIIVLLLFLAIAAAPGFGQTSGPSTPEVQTFTPHDLTQMVNTFTGDFTYNILLMDIGGFPLNLSYNSGLSPNDEAGFVGLGWNLNIGAINRTVRGLPDDFNGDTISRAFNMANEIAGGGSIGVGLQIFGYSLGDNSKGTFGLGVNVGLKYSSRKGYGLELALSPTSSIAAQNGGAKLGISLSPAIGVSSDRGVYLDAEVGFDANISNKTFRSSHGYTAGLGINSREGLESVSFGSTYLGWGKHEQGSFSLFSAGPTFTPTAGFPIKNTSLAGSIKAGGELFGTHVSGSIKGYGSVQGLSRNEDQKSAFGYMHLHNTADRDVYMDFNREKDGPYQKENPNLPLTNLTYDIFSVNGHGISGQFRPFRGDVGMVADPISLNEGFGGSAGIEIGGGQTFQVGVDVTGTISTNKTQKWWQDNELVTQILFRGSQGGSLYEPVYFKRIGELTVTENEALFYRFGGLNPIYATIDEHGKCFNDLQIDSIESRRQVVLNNNNFKTQREPRNALFSYLTADEASHVGLEKARHSFRPYPAFDANRNLLRDELPRVSDQLKPHHISEVTVTRDDGTRFVFGLPAYNHVKKEVSFSISGQPDPATGLIAYNHGMDNSIANVIGEEKFFLSTTTPAYAYAYLITAILSDDYVDITGDGPTPDDLGTYTKFNYTRAHEHFSWRIPIQPDHAFYDEGIKNDPHDDKAYYTYGEKEIWYIHSIETKNYLAVFYLSDRNDGIGIMENGAAAMPHQQLKKLESVALYAKSAWLENPADAIPAKVVYFEYDNSLCPRIPNSATANASENGKLTLKRLRFKNAGSYRDYHSPYSFEYSNNFPYNNKFIDRWGNYKTDNLEGIPNERFPYTHPHLSDPFSAAWHLTGIELPSGGKILVEYESDDYAFVQDKRAMEMVRITGSGPNISSPPQNDLNTNRYLYFKLKRPTNSQEELESYFRGIEQLYFNFKVNVHNQSDSSLFETVSGFIPFEETGVKRFGEHFGFRGAIGPRGYSEAWVLLPSVNKDDSDNIDANGVNPITKATWQTVRKLLPWYAYCDVIPCEKHNDELAKEIINLASHVASVFQGLNPHDRLAERGVGSQFAISQSFIRLYSPDQSKAGGGSRVKRLTIEDNWGQMQQPEAPDQNYAYAQEFDYSTRDEKGNFISSGVAAYEPLVGGDENPFVLPHKYHVYKPLSLGLSYYHLEPFGETFFPGPLVGYGSVTVRNIRRDGVVRTATGFVREEYYTARDFPTQVRYSNLSDSTTRRWKPVDAPPFVSEKYATVSQGYAIELNDMHGKPKAVRVFQEADNKSPVSTVEYFYKKQPLARNRLDNTVLVLNEQTGRIEPRMVGVEYDIVFDAREIFNKTETTGIQFNTDGFLIGPFLIPFPIPFPDYSKSVSRYRGIVATKVIQRVGILDSVVVTDMGSRVATGHLVYNGKTGLPVITKSPDEHHTDIYTTNFPNTWARRYDGMGPAYRNIGISHDSVRFDNLPGAARIFVRGDELLVRRLDSVNTRSVPFIGGTFLTMTHNLITSKAWVYEVGNDYVRVIDEMGKLLPRGLYSYKIIRSGRRNMQNAAIGQVVTLNSPLRQQGDGAPELQFEHVLDASAMTYSENRQTYLAFNYPADRRECFCQPLNENIATLRRILDSCQLFTHNRLLLSGLSGTIPYRTFYEGSKLRIEVLNLKTGDVVCVVEAWTADGGPFPTDGHFEFSGNVRLFTCDDDQPVMFAYRTDSDGQPGGPVTPAPPVRIIYAKANCLPLFDCSERAIPGGPIGCFALPGARVNPFVNNTLNNWRPEATYKYITDRAENGTYSGFANYWQNLNFSLSPVADPEKWQRADQSVRVDPHGNPLESRDALNRYSGVQYGYNKNMPVAIAANARYDEIGFEGFEDDAYVNFRRAATQVCPPMPHFKFRPVSGANITNEQSHTGRYSLRLNAGGNAFLNALIPSFSTSGAPEPPGSPEYTLPESALIPSFSPLKRIAQEYVISAWVKVLSQTRTPENLVHYATPGITVDIDNRPLATFRPAGPVIDGWQQITGVLALPGVDAARGMGIRLNANDGMTTYFDDIRVHPFHSVMKSYIFDPVHLRLWAELDENNFATFYEYDQEGNLMRTKKETERGIVTLQEVLAAKPKKP